MRFTEGKKCMVFVSFMINWHDRGEKSNSQPFHIFLNSVLQDGPGNK